MEGNGTAGSSSLAHCHLFHLLLGGKGGIGRAVIHNSAFTGKVILHLQFGDTGSSFQSYLAVVHDNTVAGLQQVAGINVDIFQSQLAVIDHSAGKILVRGIHCFQFGIGTGADQIQFCALFNHQGSTLFYNADGIVFTIHIDGNSFVCRDNQGGNILQALVQNNNVAFLGHIHSFLYSGIQLVANLSGNAQLVGTEGYFLLVAAITFIENVGYFINGSGHLGGNVEVGFQHALGVPVRTLGSRQDAVTLAEEFTGIDKAVFGGAVYIHHSTGLQSHSAGVYHSGGAGNKQIAAIEDHILHNQVTCVVYYGIEVFVVGIHSFQLTATHSVRELHLCTGFNDQNSALGNLADSIILAVKVNGDILAGRDHHGRHILPAAHQLDDVAVLRSIHSLLQGGIAHPADHSNSGKHVQLFRIGVTAAFAFIGIVATGICSGSQSIHNFVVVTVGRIRYFKGLLTLFALVDVLTILGAGSRIMRYGLLAGGMLSLALGSILLTVSTFYRGQTVAVVLTGDMLLSFYSILVTVDTLDSGSAIAVIITGLVSSFALGHHHGAVFTGHSSGAVTVIGSSFVFASCLGLYAANGALGSLGAIAVVTLQNVLRIGLEFHTAIYRQICHINGVALQISEPIA